MGPMQGGQPARPRGLMQNAAGEWGKYSPGGNWHGNIGNRYGPMPETYTGGPAQMTARPSGMVQGPGGQMGRYSPGGNFHPNIGGRFGPTGATPVINQTSPTTMSGVSGQPYTATAQQPGRQLHQPLTAAQQQSTYGNLGMGGVAQQPPTSTDPNVTFYRGPEGEWLKREAVDSTPNRTGNIATAGMNDIRPPTAGGALPMGGGMNPQMVQQWLQSPQAQQIIQLLMNRGGQQQGGGAYGGYGTANSPYYGTPPGGVFY